MSGSVFAQRLDHDHAEACAVVHLQYAGLTDFKLRRIHLNPHEAALTF